MDNTVNYSIIIPHKNIPVLLKRCLESIPERTDLQIIVVDDNSDSSIVDFNYFPGKDRNNTEIYFTKSGKGAGYARNIGLRNAKGKWLIFADADDFFNPFFNEALDQYLNYEYDLIFFYCNSVDCYTLKKSDRADSRNEILDRVKIEKNNDYLRYRLYAPWGKFIKRDFVLQNKITFQEVHFSNDVMFSVLTGIKANDIKISDKVIYCITNRSDSLEASKTLLSVITRLSVASKTYKVLEKIGKEQYLFWEVINYWNYVLSKSKIYAAKTLPVLFWNCGIKFSNKNFLYPLIINTIKSLLK